jgi:hypothetical protein
MYVSIALDRQIRASTDQCPSFASQSHILQNSSPRAYFFIKQFSSLHQAPNSGLEAKTIEFRNLHVPI